MDIMIMVVIIIIIFIIIIIIIIIIVIIIIIINSCYHYCTFPTFPNAFKSRVMRLTTTTDTQVKLQL